MTLVTMQRYTTCCVTAPPRCLSGTAMGESANRAVLQASGSHLDLGRARYVLCGVKYIDLVSLWRIGEQAGKVSSRPRLFIHTHSYSRLHVFKDKDSTDCEGVFRGRCSRRTSWSFSKTRIARTARVSAKAGVAEGLRGFLQRHE